MMSSFKIMCGRCLECVDEVFDVTCTEKPEFLLGAPIGQYHCPECGTMLIAGIKHPKVCLRCLEKRHPGLDEENESFQNKP